MDMLSLPVSITNWILLSDFIKICLSRVLYVKLIKDYFSMLPLYKIGEICTEAEQYLNDSDFQVVVDVIWLCVMCYRFKGRTEDGLGNDEAR